MLKKNVDTKGIICLICLAIIMFGIFCTFCYGDQIITQEHGITFLHMLFRGEILDFYPYCAENTQMVATYDLTLYVIFAIWNIPCFLYEHFTQNVAQDLGFWIMYGKSIVFAFYILSVYLLNKLCQDINIVSDNFEGQSKKYLLIYYALSPLLTLYSLYSGNYDIISVCFILYGIDALIRGKKKGFIISFAVATSMKYFPLLIFIPILLLREKRVLIIIRNILLTLSVSIVERLIFHNNTVTEEYPSSFVLSFFTGDGQVNSLGIGNMSFYMFLFIILCVYCYLQSCDDNLGYYRKIIYVSNVTWIIFFLTVPYYCYWIVYLMPFLTLLIWSTSKNMFINIVLECAFSVSMIIVSMMRAPHILGACGPFFFIPQIARNVFGEGTVLPNNYTMGHYLNEINENIGFNVFLVAIVVASILIILVINYPGKRVQSLIPTLTGTEKSITTARQVRNIISVIMYSVPTIFYVVQIIIMN